MTRSLWFGMLVLGTAGSAPAELPLAPPPREVRVDGTRDPVPPPEVSAKENPLEVVERIIKNSKDVGEKLAMTDTSTDTRKTQEKILKDIDALLNQDDPPPKSDNNPDKNEQKNKDNNQGKDKDKQDNKSGSNEPKQDMNPMGGMNSSPPKKMDSDQPSGGMEPQPNSGGDQPRERRPRMNNGEKPEPQKPKSPEGSSVQQKQPATGQPNQPPKDPFGKTNPDSKKGRPQPGPLLPFEDEVVKDVWGHLPDKLRQQATQYYKQEFMPRYSELLRLYYSSLADKK